LIGCQAETGVELPFAADSCPWVGKLRTVLPLTVGIRDGVVHLVSKVAPSREGVRLPPSHSGPCILSHKSRRESVRAGGWHAHTCDACSLLRLLERHLFGHLRAVVVERRAWDQRHDRRHHDRGGGGGEHAVLHRREERPVSSTGFNSKAQIGVGFNKTSQLLC
jgi:hypothetical protein